MMKLLDQLRILIPNPAGALWLGVIVAVVVFGDRERVFSRRNAALAGLFMPAVFLLHVLSYRYDESPNIARMLYAGVFAATAGMCAWGFVLARRTHGEPWRPNLSPGLLRALVTVLLALDVLVAVARRPDDAGIYSNLGARRWAETGILPYADARLKGPDAPAFGAAATYGPLLYASHLPFQVITGATRNPPTVAPNDPGDVYVWPPSLATRLASLSFFLLGAGALFVLARRMAGAETALGILALWASSPYVIGLGGDSHVITGLGFISHIAPSATMLAALAASSAVASGALFAAAAGVLFFPAFLFPAWFAWRFKRADRSWLSFGAGYALVAVALIVLVVAFTPPLEGKGPVRLFLESTLEHQEGSNALEYGKSIDSFWGTHPDAAAFWQRPLIGDTSLFKPTFVLFALGALLSTLWVRGRSVGSLAAIVAALASGIQLWKTHATGSYVEWYMPFLLLALIAGRADGVDRRPSSNP